MNIFVVFATVICIAIILPTMAEEDVSNPICNCFCPKPQILPKPIRCPKCPPLECHCSRCLPTAKARAINGAAPAEIVAPPQPIICNCPKCPVPITPPKYNCCICPQIMCLCVQCAELAVV